MAYKDQSEKYQDRQRREQQEKDREKHRLASNFTIQGGAGSLGLGDMVGYMYDQEGNKVSLGDIHSITFTGSHADREQGKQEHKQESKLDRMYQEGLKELEALTGIENVAGQIKEALALAQIRKRRSQLNLKTGPQTLHLVFKGNPGTGKTTVARIVGKLFFGAGMLKPSGKTRPTNRDSERARSRYQDFARVYGMGTNEEPNSNEVPFVEITNADLSSKYWGGDEENLKRKFEEADGGVLFIDEAYSMFTNHGYMDKVAAVLVAELENRRENVCCIVAGYEDEMEQFIQFNPGLASRFSNVITFSDYDVDSLMEIAYNMVKEQDYKASIGFVEALSKRLDQEKKLHTFGNARTVRNVIEQSIRRQAKRVFDTFGAAPAKEELVMLEEADLEPFNPQWSGKKVVTIKANISVSKPDPQQNRSYRAKGDMLQ